MDQRPGAISGIRREADMEKLLRPRTLDEFVGQQRIKDNLRVFIAAALGRSETLDHVILSGPPGLGKCITADSLILSCGNWVPFAHILPKDLRAGEFRPLAAAVFGTHGPEHTSHVYASGRGPTVRLRTEGGLDIEGTPHHPILAAAPDGLRWAQLGQLTTGDTVATFAGTDVQPKRQCALAGAGVWPHGSSHVRSIPREDLVHVGSNEWIRWDVVAELAASDAETYDFVVPGTHSFVANGFFSHNTTLGHIIAEEMRAAIRTTSGPVLDKPASIAGVLTNLQASDVLFIDEIHRLSPVVEEYLYSAMEDYHIDIMIDSGPNARSVKLLLPPFTLVGATTRKGLLTAPLRARFGIDLRYDYYTADQLKAIILRSARILGVAIDDEAAHEIAHRSRGTPRIANRLLRRARDFADVRGDGRITLEVADYALAALDVDEEGLDDMDARILLTLIEKFSGGPTGLVNLAVSVGEDAGTIEEVYEPYLIQEGYLERTPRGRVATARSWSHFGMVRPERPGELFAD